MNDSEARSVTLWCALLSKAEKGIERSLPDRVPLLSGRILMQLAVPGTPALRNSQLAHVLVARPSDVSASLEVLGSQGQVECEAGYFLLTDEGQRAAAEVEHAVRGFMRCVGEGLDAEDIRLLKSFVYHAVSKPRSYFAQHPNALQREKTSSMPYVVTTVAMTVQAMGMTAKRVAKLSLTDYRFLLELMPKRRSVVKQLRAKDLVQRLRVGRSYVTTAGQRLEKHGLVERIPDEHDARGVLFALTFAGEHVVHAVGDDIYAALRGLFGEREFMRERTTRAVRLLLQETDRALG